MRFGLELELRLGLGLGLGLVQAQAQARVGQRWLCFALLLRRRAGRGDTNRAIYRLSPCYGQNRVVFKRFTCICIMPTPLDLLQLPQAFVRPYNAWL